jgi:hypothetical protein
MIKKVILVVGLPGSGKTTYARNHLMTDDTFLIDDPNRDTTLFDQAEASGKSNVVICDPLLILKEPEHIEAFLKKRYGESIDFEWLYFENDRDSAWSNHCKRNETDPRVINEKFHKHLSESYRIPENAIVIPVYKP